MRELSNYHKAQACQGSDFNFVTDYNHEHLTIRITRVKDMMSSPA